MHSKPGHRTQRRWPGRSWLVAGLVALANSGCSQTSEELRGRLHILVTTPSHEALSNSEQDNILSPVRLLASGEFQERCRCRRLFRRPVERVTLSLLLCHLAVH
jgi:hypothetical protein